MPADADNDRNIVGYTRVLPPFVPFLTAACPLLVYYNHNINELQLSDLLPPLAGTFTFAAAVFLFFLAVVRRLVAASLGATVVLFATLHFAILRETLQEALGRPVPMSLMLSGVGAATMALLFIIQRCVRPPRATVTALAAFFAVQIAWVTVNIADYETRRMMMPDVPPDTYVGLDGLAPAEKQLRHIFYIVLDRYAGPETLSSVYGYDDSEFIDFLKQSGFQVPAASTANYLKTGHSLASTLNMTYLDYLAEGRYVADGDNAPVYALLRDFRLSHVLKGLGYRYAVLGSWWNETQSSDDAEYNLLKPSLSEFDMRYLARTMLPGLAELTRGGDERSAHGTCEATKAQFRALNSLSYLDGPTFVFAHFLTPHPPYVVDVDGSCLGQEVTRGRSEAENYIRQLRWVNGEIKRFIEIVKTKLSPQPIVIIQSDEGPYPARYKSHLAGFDWHQASPQELRQKTLILNAYYLPGVSTPLLPDDLTPVNSFRLVLDLYFGAKLRMLENRVMAFPSFDDVYDFFDVTDLVSRKLPGGGRDVRQSSQ